MSDELPETMIGLFVKQLNAKLADDYRVLRAENKRLTVENRYLFEVIMDDALLVERYNAFKERAALADQGSG